MDLNSTMATVRTSSYYKSNGSSESIPDPSFDPQSECAQDEIDAENIAFAQEIRSRTTIDSSIPFLPLERTDSNRSTQLELPQVCHDAPSPINVFQSFYSLEVLTFLRDNTNAYVEWCRAAEDAGTRTWNLISL